MASIRKRNGRYTAVIRKQGFEPVYRTFASKRRAEQWATRTEMSFDDGELVEAVRYSLNDAIDLYIGEPDRQLDTYQRGILEWWRGQLGPRRLTSLRRGDFMDARDELRKFMSTKGTRLAASTVNRRLNLISAVLTAAMNRDWMRSNPARIKGLQESARDRLLTEDERRRLLEAASAHEEPHLYAFIVSAMLSGARAGELRGLRWRDLDLERGVARLLKTKNGKTRAIPVRGRALELLRQMSTEHDATCPDGDDYVFKNKTGFSPFYYRKAWAEIVEEAQLHDVRFHDLRHLAASMLAMSGASQRELQEVLGHESAAMTTRYAHFFDRHIAELGDRIQKRLFEDVT